MMKRLIFVMLALMAVSMAVEAQTVKVKGTVRDAKTGEELPLVNVGLMRQADTVFVRGAATDFDGEFAIKDVKPGSYLLQASSVGYESYLVMLDVKDDLEDLEIKLRAGTLLEEVEIVAEKPLYQMDGEKNMYNTKEDPSIQTGTASDALQNAPGVEVDAEGNITLRGVSSVEIWVNDRPSHMNEEALKQYIKQMPANAIERIEVITNPSARYSTTGGVINIVTNQKVTRNELLCVGFRANTMPSFSPWASYVYANEKFDMNIYVNANIGVHNMYSDGTNTLFDDNGDTSRYQSSTSETHSRNYGGYSGLNLNWNISDKTHLATWLGVYPYWGNNSSELDLVYREYQPTLRNLGYHYDLENPDGFGWGGYMGAWLEHRFDSTGRKLSFSLNGNTWNENGIGTETFAYADPTMDSLLRRTEKRNASPSGSMTLNYTHPLKHDLELEAGMELELGGGTQYLGLDTLGTDGYHAVALRVSDGLEHGTGLNGYVTLQKRWGGFTAKLGLRGEQRWKRSEWSHLDGTGMTVVDTSFFGLVPSLHLSYQTKTFTSYSLSYTLRNTTPGMTQLSPFRTYEDYSYSTGNPNLLRTYTHNLEAAWSKYIAGFGMLNVNAYFRANKHRRNRHHDLRRLRPRVLRLPAGQLHPSGEHRLQPHRGPGGQRHLPPQRLLQRPSQRLGVQLCLRLRRLQRQPLELERPPESLGQAVEQAGGLRQCPLFQSAPGPLQPDGGQQGHRPRLLGRLLQSPALGLLQRQRHLRHGRMGQQHHGAAVPDHWQPAVRQPLRQPRPHLAHRQDGARKQGPPGRHRHGQYANEQLKNNN